MTQAISETGGAEAGDDLDGVSMHVVAIGHAMHVVARRDINQQSILSSSSTCLASHALLGLLFV